MKRTAIEPCINIIINDNGKIPPKSFEVVKIRTIQRFNDAVRLFKALLLQYPCVYMYRNRWGYRVEFRTYVTSLQEAIQLRDEVEGLLGVLESEE